MSLIHRLLELQAAGKRSPRGAHATHRVLSDPPWDVTVVTTACSVLLVCCHMYKRSAVRLQRLSHDRWERMTMDERYERARKLVDQARGKPAGNDAPRFLQDPEFEARYPILHAFLFPLGHGKEEAPQGASLTLFCDGSELKLVLNDRATDRSLWASERTVSAALQLLEDRLGGDFVEWRRNRSAKRK